MANFPILSPFNVMPDPTKIVQQGDPYAELQQLIANMQQGSPIAPQRQGTLQTILNSLAEGASVLASSDSGAALGNILKGRQERADKFTTMNAEYQNNLNMLKLQAAVERARGITSEQTEARREQRQNIYNIQEGKRKLSQAKELKEFETINAIKELELKEKFLNESEPARLVREKNRILLEDIPKQRRDAVEWEAMATALVENADPIMATRVAKKLAGLDPTPFTTAEAQFKAEVDKARFKQSQLKLEEARADIDLKKANTEYTRAGKPGSSAFQDRFANSYNGALARDVVENLDNQYFRTSDNRILTAEEIQKLPIVDPGKFSNRPLSPEENAKEVMRRVEKLKQLRMQQQQQTNNEIKVGDIPDKVQRAFELGVSKKYSTEQMRVLLNANGATIEQINKLVPAQSPQAQQEVQKGQIPKTPFERAMEVLGKGFKIPQQ